MLYPLLKVALFSHIQWPDVPGARIDVYGEGVEESGRYQYASKSVALLFLSYSLSRILHDDSIILRIFFNLRHIYYSSFFNLACLDNGLKRVI